MELASFKVLADVTAWIGLEDAGERKALSSFVACLGSPKMMRQIAAIPLKAYEDATATWRIPDKVGTDIVDTAPTPVELGHVGLLRRVIRILLNLNPDESVAPAPSATPGSGVGMAAMVSSAVQQALPAGQSKNKILVSKVLDQADDSEVSLMDPLRAAKLIEDWKTAENDGEEPCEEEEATVAQLSALETRINIHGTTFTDFGIWRPFGNRMGRALKFTVHSMRPDGSVAPREVSGPADFTAWAKSWRVFAFAMAALGQASRTRLARYYERISKLNEEFPRYWWVVGLADIRMRSEYLERVRRTCVKKHAAGELQDFDPNRPWDVTFREAAQDKDYWAREVDKKVLLHITSIAPASSLIDEGYGLLEEAASAVSSGRGGGKKNGGKRRAASSSSEAGQQSKKRKRNGRAKNKTAAPGPNTVLKEQPKGGKGKGGGKQKADGKHVRYQGSQICWDYNRQAGGCTDICPNARAHVCELCLGQHRATSCTVVPRGPA